MELHQPAKHRRIECTFALIVAPLNQLLQQLRFNSRWQMSTEDDDVVEVVGGRAHPCVPLLRRVQLVEIQPRRSNCNNQSLRRNGPRVEKRGSVQNGHDGHQNSVLPVAGDWYEEMVH